MYSMFRGHSAGILEYWVGKVMGKMIGKVMGNVPFSSHELECAMISGEAVAAVLPTARPSS
jgi:hypothetical protein